MSTPTCDGLFEVYNDDDLELLKVRRQRRNRENLLEPDHCNTLREDQTQVTPLRNLLCEGTVDHLRSKTLSQNGTNEDENTMSKLPPEDKIMADTIIDLTENDHVKLPSLHHVLLEADRTSDPEGNIDRPSYNEWARNDGFVAWWDNRSGKGMIINYRHCLEHKVALEDIKCSNYGALIPGSMVEYEYSDNGYCKGFSKFWVVSGCEYVL